MKYCPVSSQSWNLCTCNVWSCYVQGFGRRCIYKKIHYMTLTQYVLDLSQGHTKCSSVPSTSCDLCTCIVWSCYVERFGRRCIYKKIHYVTFDLDIGVKVTQNVAQNSLHHVTYAAIKFEVATSNGLGWNAFTRKFIIWSFDLELGVKVTQNVAQYTLHHVIYAATPFEVATSNGLGGDTLTSKYILWPCPCGQGHKKCCPVPSTPCDLCSCKCLSCYVS